MKLMPTCMRGLNLCICAIGSLGPQLQIYEFRPRYSFVCIGDIIWAKEINM